MQAKAKTQEEVEQRISDWHEKKDIKVELHTYLGWTKEEYMKWVETNELPKDDLRQMND